MSELRRDPISGRWVIVDTDHPSHPADFEYEPHSFKGGACPFCMGNESLTPPEVDAIRAINSAKDTAGWKVRVVPNKFPALKNEGNIDRRGIGIYDMSNGIGDHEVLIESPYHDKDIHQLEIGEVVDFLTMYKQRTLALEKDARFKYILIFKNFGLSAGASLEHPHTQLVALPMIPKNVREELTGAANYFEYRERCIFCDIIRQEQKEKERIIYENDLFLSFCPFVSRFAFETWIIPKNHRSSFSEIFIDEISQLAKALTQTLSLLKIVFPDVSYNFIIHTSPINGDSFPEGYHWHLELMPKLTRVAGFEWGSGFYSVCTPPELAAKILKEA